MDMEKFREISSDILRKADEIPPEKAQQLAALCEEIEAERQRLEAVLAMRREHRILVEEAMQIAEEAALIVRRWPVKCQPGTPLRDIVRHCLIRERRIMSGPLPLRLLRAIVEALKGE